MFVVWSATFLGNYVIKRSLGRLIKLRILLWALPHITEMILDILRGRETASLLRSKSGLSTTLVILKFLVI